MMRNVIGRPRQQLLQRARPAFVVVADALQSGIGQLGQDARQLTARRCDDCLFLLQIALVVEQGGGEALLVGAD